MTQVVQTEIPNHMKTLRPSDERLIRIRYKQGLKSNANERSPINEDTCASYPENVYPVVIRVRQYGA